MPINQERMIAVLQEAQSLQEALKDLKKQIDFTRRQIKDNTAEEHEGILRDLANLPEPPTYAIHLESAHFQKAQKRNLKTRAAKYHKRREEGKPEGVYGPKPTAFHPEPPTKPSTFSIHPQPSTFGIHLPEDVSQPPSQGFSPDEVARRIKAMEEEEKAQAAKAETAIGALNFKPSASTLSRIPSMEDFEPTLPADAFKKGIF